METPSRGLEKGLAAKGVGAAKNERAVSLKGNRPAMAGQFSQASVTVIPLEVQVTA
jgi:hypothetical protein